MHLLCVCVSVYADDLRQVSFTLIADYACVCAHQIFSLIESWRRRFSGGGGGERKDVIRFIGVRARACKARRHVARTESTLTAIKFDRHLHRCAWI